MEMAALLAAGAAVALLLWRHRAARRVRQPDTLFAGRPMIRMTYADRDGVITERDVIILSMDIENGRVTRFQGWCLMRSAQREFRTDRVLMMRDLRTGAPAPAPAEYLLRYAGPAAAR